MRGNELRRAVGALLLCAAITGETYILLTRGGEVQVYRGVYAGEPEFIAQVDPAALPGADARALERGVVVHGKIELARILEDFGS